MRRTHVGSPCSRRGGPCVSPPSPPSPLPAPGPTLHHRRPPHPCRSPIRCCPRYHRDARYVRGGFARRGPDLPRCVRAVARLPPARPVSCRGAACLARAPRPHTCPGLGTPRRRPPWSARGRPIHGGITRPHRPSARRHTQPATLTVAIGPALWETSRTRTAAAAADARAGTVPLHRGFILPVYGVGVAPGRRAVARNAGNDREGRMRRYRGTVAAH